MSDRDSLLMTDPPTGAKTEAGAAPSRRRPLGLSGRVLLLTVLFVLIAEILIYVPSVANFRNTWLGDRLAQAKAAALILEKTPPDTLPRAVVDELLASIDTTMIALRIQNMRRLLAISDMPPTVDYEVDLRTREPIREIFSAFQTLLFGGDRTIRVVGPPPRGGDFVEIVINERPLRDAMIRYSWNILLVSLVISAITAILVFAALNGLIVKPVKNLAQAVGRFSADPSDARSLYSPAARGDEFGSLERSVAEMQRGLQQELRQREHLANLGLAVAKINHDLRNMLASAQLMADRLGSLPDPNVQRFVPKLLEALDRAINFCMSTLAYGKAQERPAESGPVPLRVLALEVAEQLMLTKETRPAIAVEIAPELHAHADADHLNRVMTNLLRNAVAALEASAAEASPLIRIAARETREAVEIDVSDNGPGIPAQMRERLFRAFSGSSRPGSTGLGLAIAHELMRGMGGTITAIETPDGASGTTFRLVLPKA
jgi:signal transduction histidine kinase